MLYFLSRIPIAFLTLVLVATICFSLTKLAGEEAAFGDRPPTPEVRAQIEAQWGLNLPLHEQYLLHISKLLVLDSMESRIQKNQSLRDILQSHFPASLRLGFRALILAIALGIPIGVISAVYHNRVIDNGGMLFALVGVSVPSFILASITLYVLSSYFRWNVIGWDRPSFPGWMGESMRANPVVQEIFRLRLWIPAACLGAFPFAAIIRLTRSSMLDALQQDYVRTARAKGLTAWKVVVRHALRNALTPVVTYLGPVTAGVLTGSLVVEKIFAIPGIGRFFVDSVSNRDLPMIMGLTVFYSALLITMNLLVDAVYPVLNPKLRR